MTRAVRFVVVAVVGVLIVVLLGVISTNRSGETATQDRTMGEVTASPSDPAPAPPAPDVGVLLLQVLDATGYASVNVAIGVTPPAKRPRTSLLEIPPTLLVPAGESTVPLGRTPLQPDTLAAVDGVRRELRLDIDAGLEVDRLAFAGWVDGVNGVWLFVDDTFVTRPTSPDEEPRTVRPGWTRLDGLTATEYVLATLPGETAQEHHARAMEVVETVIARMPETPERMRQLVTSLGSLAQSTVPTDDLVPFLLRVRADIRFGRVDRAVLPVEVVRGGIRGASIPAPRAWVMLKRLFPDSRIEPGADVTG